MSNPSGSTSYRNPKIEDDEDDLDDLDDVLANFNAKPSAAPPIAPPPQTATPAADDAEDDEDFEASLVEGMESLLRQLAGDHPPGPMADVGANEVKINGKAPASTAGGGKALSPEEEEAAWQKAVETLLSGEGLSALGLEDEKDKKGKARATAPEAPGSFEETIRRTMESLKAGGEGSKANGNAEAPDLAALLKQLSENPGALDGLGDGDEDDPLGGLLDGMMSQLMTKEILEEPMGELASKYPGYLASPPSTVAPADLEKYKQQYALVQRILDTFRKPDYSDEKDGKEIAKLVGEMQDLGGPPQEIMGDLPEGFDLGGLGGEEGCSIM